MRQARYISITEGELETNDELAEVEVACGEKFAKAFLSAHPTKQGIQFRLVVLTNGTPPKTQRETSLVGSRCTFRKEPLSDVDRLTMEVRSLEEHLTEKRKELNQAKARVEVVSHGRSLRHAR